MSAVAIFTLVLVGLLVAALAFYLLWVFFILRAVIDTLSKVTFGARAIAHRTEPVIPVMTEVNANLGAVADALEELVTKVTTSKPAARTS